MIARFTTVAPALIFIFAVCPFRESRIEARIQGQSGQSGDDVLKATVLKKTEVRSEPSLQAEILGTLKQGAGIEVIDYLPARKLFMIRYKKRPGYVESDAVRKTEEIDRLVERATERLNRRPPSGRKGPEPGNPIPNRAAKRQVLALLYGEEIAARLMEARLWRGMTKQMAIQSIGEPKSIKRTSFPNIVKEEWLYEDGTRLHFENDILKAYGGPPVEVPGP